jgi:site-specific DNA-methyltransferase (adenine-specific)
MPIINKPRGNLLPDLGVAPFYAADGIAVYHADARDLLPLLVDGSVDFVFTDPPYGHNNPVHPTVKPEALAARFIRLHTRPGDLVLDPFAGEGTTLAAAKKLGRRAIGIELEERWCARAARRLESIDLPSPAVAEMRSKVWTNVIEDA